MTNNEPTMELIYVDPKTLIIDTNVRTIIDLDPHFLDSIREAGVRQPPTCWRDDEDQIHVECGQRRTLAAVQTGLAEIPVLVLSRESAVEERLAERDRIVSQIAENDHRSALTDGERVQAFQQLALFGMTADEIASATKTKRDRVRAAVRLTKENPDTVELMQERQLTLEDALVLQEFQDHPEMVDQLEITLRDEPVRVPRLVEDLRRTIIYRAEEERCAALAAEAGVTEWRTNREVTTWNGNHRELHEVRIGKATAAPTLEEAIEQGGVIATMNTSYRWADGERTASNEVKYYIEDATEHGYKIPRAAAASNVTEEEREQRRKERAELKERKARWGDACEFRHRWIKEQLRSNTAIKTQDQSASVLAKALFSHRDIPYSNLTSVAREKQLDLTLVLLGDATDFSTSSDWMRTSHQLDRLAYLTGVSPISAIEVSLAFVLAGVESIIANPKTENYSRDHQITPYLLQLNAWGYPLAEIEQELVDAHTTKQQERAALAAADTSEEN